MQLFPRYHSYADSSTLMSAPSGIQGHLLEVTVVGCNKLRDTEWISRQDPYVCLEYANTKFRTRTCTDGHKDPTFQEKFVFSLIEGLRELNVVVWNSNTLTYDDFIGSGKVQLQKVLAQGYDDTPWTLQSKSGRYAGEVRLILHYANAKRPGTGLGHLAPNALPVVSPYSALPPPTSSSLYPTVEAYPASTTYPSFPPLPNPTAYPPSAYPPQPTTAYPPQPYPPTSYPPQPYPPQIYPPPPQANLYHPPGPYPGVYPPPY